MRGRDNSNSGYRPYLKSGAVRFTDDLSGFQRASTDAVFTWDGFMTIVGETYYERNPQDFPLFTRGVTSVLNARPLNMVNAPTAYNYHVAGTNDENYLTFQGNSLIEMVYYPLEYVGEPS